MSDGHPCSGRFCNICYEAAQQATPTSALTVEQAEDLAARTLGHIPATTSHAFSQGAFDADRERVVSDLAGLRRHKAADWGWSDPDDPDPLPLYCEWCTYDARTVAWPCSDAQDRSASLIRTAGLYAVTPRPAAQEAGA